MKALTKVLFLASSFLCVGVSQSVAQEQGDFARDRDFSVLGRARPDYDAIGMPFGDFLLFPQLGVVGGYDDNILATQTNTKSDAFVQIQPSLSLKSQWSSHELDVAAHGSINRYGNYSSEDTDDYGASVNGRLDVLSSTNITGAASYDLETESREAETSIGNISPIQYGLWTGQLSTSHDFNRLRVSFSGTWDQYNYLDGRDALGNVIDEHFRNVQDTGETLRADYALSPDTALFVSGNLNQHAYSLKPPSVSYDFNSTGYEILSGVNFQITKLLTGEVSVGYLAEDYPHVLGQTYGNIAMHASVQWYPTELTTVSMKGDRLVQDSTLLNSPGYVTTGGSIEVDHELRYNVILTGLFGYADDTYQSIDRDDRTWTVGFGAKYLLNRNVGISLNFNHDSRASYGLDRYISFDANKVMLNLVLQE